MNPSRVLLTVCLLASVPLAGADVTLTEESVRTDGNEAATTRIYVTSERLRVDDLSESGETVRAFLFEAPSGIFRMLDFSLGTYVELTPADMERMSAEGPTAPPPVQTEYRLLGSGETVGRWSTSHYEGIEAGERVWEIWTADWEEADLAASDFTVFERLAEVLEGFGGGSFLELDPEGEGPYSGLPVRRIAWGGGLPQLRFEITDIDRRPVDPGLFELPEGFTRAPIAGFAP